MKKIIGILFIIIAICVSCGNSGKDKTKAETKDDAVATETSEKPQNSTEAKQEPKSKVIELSYKQFIKDVWDMEKYPDSFVYQSNIPCIVDFYADWCGPCRMVAPIMSKIAEQYEGKLIVYKVNTDIERKLAAIMKIRSIPTVLFFPVKGQPASQVGALSEEQYIAIINKHLLNK